MQASEGGSFLTFDDVQERMVDAMRLWWRSPDREHGWLTIRAYWPEMRRHNHFGDYADTEASPRPLPLSRAEVAEMTTVSEWMRFVPEEDRKLVVLALTCLARGHSRVPWLRLRKPMGVRLGADGLRKRYSKALTMVANAVNGAEIRAEDGQEKNARERK